MSAVYSSGQSASNLATSHKAVPLRRDLEFVRSDHMEDGPFFWPNKVYTPDRPLDADDLPMYHSSETVPVGVEASPTELIAAWERKNWFSEIRSSYLSTIRYYNGWVPWYGLRPNANWYRASSLGAFADILATYDATPDAEGTKVYVDFPSHRTTNLNPGGRYRWDLRSASPWEINEDTDDVINFTKIHTHLSGAVAVRAEWSMGIPIGGGS